MNRIYICFFFSGFLLLLGCKHGSETGYEPPEGTVIYPNSLFDPLYAGEILEPPLKCAELWNDSVLAMCGIKEVRFSTSQADSQEKGGEFCTVSINSSGNWKCYRQFDPLKKRLTTEVCAESSNGVLNGIRVPLFYGERSDIFVSVLDQGEKRVFLSQRVGDRKDSLIVYKRNGRTLLVVEKFGDFVSMIHCCLDEETPFRSMAEILKKAGITQVDLLSAERRVTLFRRKLPVSTYLFTEDLVKGELTEKWTYNVDGQLTVFERFVHNSLLKELKFKYDENRLLHSLEQNGTTYFVTYN